jgi:hypothetical protein
VRLEVGEVDKLEGRDVAGFQDDAWGAARIKGFSPAFHAEAPFVAVFQSGELVLWTRGAEVVSPGFGKLEEGIRYHRANGMQAKVFSAGAAVAVPIKTCQGAGATARERASENIRTHSKDDLAVTQTGQGAN